MKEKLLFFAAISLLCTSCLGSFSEGERLFRNGSYEEAIVEFSRNLFLNVTDVKSLHLRARSYEEIGELDKAIDDYQTILRYEPAYAQAFAGIGKIYWKKEDYPNAEKYLLLAANEDASDFEILLLLGRAMLMNENYDSADEFLQMAKELSPEDPTVYFYQGMARSQIGDLLGAAGSFNMCLKYDSENLTARYNRGLVLLVIGYANWALEDFDSILQANPSHFEALARRGKAKTILNDPTGCYDLRQAAQNGSLYAQLHLEDC